MKEFIEIPFGTKDSELGGWEYNIPEGYTASIENGKIIVKKEESEDEISKSIIGFLKTIASLKDGKTVSNEDFDSKALLEWTTWLEKQDAKVSVYKDTLFKISTILSQYEDKEDSPLEKIRSIMIDGTICSMDLESKNKKQGEQNHVDKVEPRFKVGDWVVASYGDTNQVITVDEDVDGFTLDDGTYFSGSWCDMYHLWTIGDAKDGDVLVTKNGNPFIYDKGRYNNGLAYYYAGLNVNGELTIKSPHHMLAHFGSLYNVIPATKEQRDLLFQKMKEAGYEWDADKKELNNIEQTHFWSKDDDSKIESICRLLKTRFDKDTCDEVGFTRDKMCDYLISLKNKIQPKWKPSGAQIRAIEDSIEFLGCTKKVREDLKSLYEQLKKLMEK